MNERDKQLLYHIRKNCVKIKKYHERFGNSLEIFLEDDAYRDAVSMCIMQIGELAKGFSEEFSKDTDFPLKEIRGMRNVLAHNYVKADIETIWNTSIEDIPNLCKKCNKLL